MAGAGLAGLLLGGFPVWAAHRILYPANFKQLPAYIHGLSIENGQPAEYVEFSARDGKTLTGWFVPAPASVPPPWPAILLIYGYGGHKEQMAGYAQILHDAGFASFMFDMQGSGRRRGQPVTLGYLERWDAVDAARYLTSREDVDSSRIGALGISMGAATALMAAEHDTTIRAIVADSSYANLDDMVQPGLRTFVGSPAVIYAPLIVRIAETMLGMKSSQVQPAISASKLGDRAVFIIHGEDDPLTNPQSAHKIFAACSGPKELWMIPNCGHTLGPVATPEEYRARVAGFLRIHLDIQ
jgi:dipeptidyl aminopeptidase/acylaminoacyl peptidase